MDGRKNNGGHSTKGKAGRPSKTDEQKQIESLSPFEPLALKQLNKNLVAGEKWAVELFFKYFYRLPKQGTDITSNGDKIVNPFIMFGSNKDDR